MIMNPFEETAPNYTVATYFASKEFIEKNPEVVDRFVRAMNKSLDYAQEHPDEVRKVVPTYTQIPDAAVKDMVLPTFGSQLDEQDIQLTIDLADKYGYIEEKPALEDLIRKSEG
jgi:NitT/TauT family transport system substrate-binding protein